MFDSGGRILGHSQGRERGIREIERYCCRSRDSCGFGMRGQKSRLVLVLKVSRMDRCPFTSVSQNSEALLEGMHAGLLKFVPVNLKIIKAAGFQEGDEVSLESLKKKGIINPSGRERRLPLKFSAMKLDKRLSDLGAEAIVERGLGDDQHPSGCMKA
ncbi:hypothetical protein NE237_019808 [Protea cynaroides]|uniref:Uncharacterized protein n=1 Tax=Protea cynaroides TaxID=273540 RepID=A0A9Q0K3A4_9MAGN|nr:hypothetical protein NE237_019808 [Protea cynaroides]